MLSPNLLFSFCLSHLLLLFSLPFLSFSLFFPLFFFLSLPPFSCSPLSLVFSFPLSLASVPLPLSSIPLLSLLAYFSPQPFPLFPLILLLPFVPCPSSLRPFRRLSSSVLLTTTFLLSSLPSPSSFLLIPFINSFPSSFPPIFLPSPPPSSLPLSFPSFLPTSLRPFLPSSHLPFLFSLLLHFFHPLPTFFPLPSLPPSFPSIHSYITQCQFHIVTCNLVRSSPINYTHLQN